MAHSFYLPPRTPRPHLSALRERTGRSPSVRGVVVVPKARKRSRAILGPWLLWLLPGPLGLLSHPARLPHHLAAHRRARWAHGGAVVVPQAMAYATIADLPVQYGLYTCMLPMVVYAALGGSRALSMSTTSTIATLVATSLVGLSTISGGGDSEARIRALATLTVLVGVILLVARVLRLGSLVQNISHATLTGIKASVGLTVAVGQVPKLLGAQETLHGHGFVPELRAAVGALRTSTARPSSSRSSRSPCSPASAAPGRGSPPRCSS
ncbi:SulP family inorganic anion transporter [Oerskovia sp. M15]